MSSKKSPSSSDENFDESELSRKLKSCVRVVERRLTPSGLLDSGDFQVPVLFPDDYLGDIWDTSRDSSYTADVVDVPDTTQVNDAAPDLLSISTLPFNPVTNFDLGVFTVGETGQVSVDYLYDGGHYQGQLAIFSLNGMESFEHDSTAFIHEAATRALSNSNLGHILIDDLSQAAYFASGDNSGQYLGEKTFSMQAGDRFGMMLVPNGTVQTVFDTPDADGEIRPLFSMATANPDDAYHVGQIADMFGDGKTFVFEDLRVDTGSDGDFNDLVFHIKGATGQAVTFDQLIADGLLDPQKDFRHTEIGQQIAANADPYIADGKVFPGDPLHPSLPAPTIPHTNVDQGGNGFSGVIGTSVEPNQGGALPDLPTLLKSSLTQDVIDQVGGNDPFDIYRVSGQQLTGTEISVLSGSTTISILSPQGDILSQQIFDRGTHTLNLPTDISGDVLLKFSSTNGADSTYILQGFESQAKEPFNIDLEFASGITASQQAIIREAANFVQSLIGQGLPSAIVDGKIIDDINFKISATNLDGAGGTLAQTKIDFMRYGTLLPAQSITQFDLSDLAKLEQSGDLADVVKHELLHGLGFGNLWEAKGLIAYANTPLMQYKGKQAVQKFQELGGLTDAISLETEGSGSAGLHWHEALFQDEIMTADLNGDVGNAAISTVTLASLADLGYVVNFAKANPDYKLLGGQSFSGDGLTSEQIEAFRKLAEITFESTDAEYIAPILPTVDPDKIAPEIWAHAERFWRNGEYYDWREERIPSGATISNYVLNTMARHPSSDPRTALAKANDPAYWNFIANANGFPNPNFIVAGNIIRLPVWYPNYEWEQEQERLRREEELRQRQEEEARIRREQEEAFAREQERVRLEEEARQREAEARQRELEEQERRLREDLERRRQEEERRLEEARLAELARLAEIARQQGKGGLDWFVAKTLPEFGPVDPFETRLTGETVGNLVPDDYYRFTLSRKGRIDARLMNLLADADLVLYDVRNRPISYSMREGITDEQILVDLIPGTYMLRVNSPKGVTTDYDLIVKFKHLLSQSEQGPPPGWRVGGGTGNGGGGATSPLFSDSRIQRIYDTALGNFAGPERAKANTQIANLKAEKLGYEQQMKALLDQMNGEQRAKVYNALDNARHNANVWVDNIANPIKNTVDGLGNGIIDAVNSVANRLENTVNGVPDFGNGWVRDRKDDAKRMINQGRDAVVGGVNSAKSWLTGKLNDIQNGVKSAIWHFFETIKNAYRTGAEINQIIANAAQDFRNTVDRSVRDANDLIGQFKGKVLSVANWTRNLGIDQFGIKFNVYDNLVKPAVDNISGGVQSAINGVGNTLKGIVDWIEPRTQKVVADIVNALFGDKTGYLWNQINGVDAKIEATRTGLEKAISAAGKYILNVGRQIEAFLTNPEERKRVLEALWKWGFKTVDDAYNFIIKKRDEVRKDIEAEEEARRKAEEEARRKAEEEARRKAEEEARRKAEEEARLGFRDSVILPFSLNNIGLWGSGEQGLFGGKDWRFDNIGTKNSFGIGDFWLNMKGGVGAYASTGTASIQLPGLFDFTFNSSSSEFGVLSSGIGTGETLLSSYLGAGLGLDFELGVGIGLNEDIPFIGGTNFNWKTSLELDAADVAIGLLPYPYNKLIGESIDLDTGINITDRQFDGNKLDGEDNLGLKMSLTDFLLKDKEAGGIKLEEFLSLDLGVYLNQKTSFELKGFQFDHNNDSSYDFKVDLGNNLDFRTLPSGLSSLRVQPIAELKTILSFQVVGEASASLQNVIDSVIPDKQWIKEMVKINPGGFNFEPKFTIPFKEFTFNPFEKSNSWTSFI